MNLNFPTDLIYMFNGWTTMQTDGALPLCPSVNGLKFKSCAFGTVIEVLLKVCNIPHVVAVVGLTEKPSWFEERTTPTIFWKGKLMSETADIIKLVLDLYGDSHIAKFCELPPANESDESGYECKTVVSKAKPHDGPIHTWAFQFMMKNLQMLLKKVNTMELEDIEAGRIPAADEEKMKKLKEARDELPEKRRLLQEAWTEIDDLYRKRTGKVYLYGDRPSVDDAILLTMGSVVRNSVALLMLGADEPFDISETFNCPHYDKAIGRWRSTDWLSNSR